MIPISDKFIINEGFLDWMKNSISNILGRRMLNKPLKSQITSNEKIQNTEQISKRLTPKPSLKKPTPTGLGFKKFHIYKHPVNLP